LLSGKKAFTGKKCSDFEFALNYRNDPFLLMLHSSFAEISNFKKLLKGLLKGFHGSIRLLCP
jgi:hypothetical protein